MIVGSTGLWMAESASCPEKGQNEGGDITKVSKIMGLRRPIADSETEHGVSRVTRSHVLDIAVVACDEQEDRRVECLEQASQERIDQFEGSDSASHASAVPCAIGRVVGIQRQVVALSDAREVRSGLDGAHVR